MMTMCCFVWALGLRLWSGSEAKIGILVIFLKIYIRPPVSVLFYLILFYILYGLLLFRKGDFRHVKCL